MTEIKELPTLIPFGPFEADFRSQELRKQGVRLRLPRQSFQILKMLLERPGEVVTREELRAKLWPADTFVDFDHGLNAAVKRLRDALGDTAENPRYIETLPRQGYRLISATAPKVATVPDTIQPEKRQSPARRWGLPLIAATVLLSAVALLALDAGGLRSKFLSSSGTRPQIRSLAVLPLADMSGDPQQEYFADGMTEELIGELSRLSALKVISRTSVMQYKGERKKSLSQIGRELNVDAVMEGSVLRSGNRVRIGARMIYAPTDQNLMAETYERDLGDVLKLQGEVAHDIAQRVRMQLTPQQQARLSSARVVNPEAYEAYLKGSFYLRTGFNTEQGSRTAQSFFEEAIQKDSTFARPYVGLAKCYSRLGAFRWLPPQYAYTKSKEAISKALQLDDAPGEAHGILAWLSWRHEWDWRTAEKEFNYALKLSPNDANSRAMLAVYLGASGRRPEAEAELNRVRELDPTLSYTSNIQLVIFYHQRDYPQMVSLGRKLVAAKPADWDRHYFLAVGYEGTGQTPEAIPEYQKAVELSQGDQDPTAALAHAYATMGQRAEALKILREWQRQSQTSYVSPYMVATVYASLGDKDKAFEYLEKAYQERSSDLPYFLRADLRIDNLRSDPRLILFAA